MKVSGFTFIRNAELYDYPIVEAIRSVLPLCDEFVIALGNCDDNTRQLIENIGSDKIKIFDTVWDASLRNKGEVLAVETNKALSMVSRESDWCIYIQGDECVHEKDWDVIRNAMETFKNEMQTDGFVLSYYHFYGNYNYVSDSFSRYRREVRIIRNNRGIESWGDAQGFRKNGKKIHVRTIDANIYHYGWVRHPAKQHTRFKYMHTLWHSDEKALEMSGNTGEFEYNTQEYLIKFEGTHPGVMEKRIADKNWGLPFNPELIKPTLKVRFKMLLHRLSGLYLGEYRNFIELK